MQCCCFEATQKIIARPISPLLKNQDDNDDNRLIGNNNIWWSQIQEESAKQRLEINFRFLSRTFLYRFSFLPFIGNLVMLPAMVNKYVVKNLVKMKGEQQLCVYM